MLRGDISPDGMKNKTKFIDRSVECVRKKLSISTKHLQGMSTLMLCTYINHCETSIYLDHILVSELPLRE